MADGDARLALAAPCLEYPGMETAELVLRFAGVAQLAVLVAVLAREAPRTRVAVYACLFLLGLGGYLMCPLFGGQWDVGFAALPVFLLCFSVAALFWLFSRAWFDDGFRLTWPVAGLALLPALLGTWQRFVGPAVLGEPETASLLAHKFLSLGFALAAVVQARLGRDDDLIDSRRRLRDLFVVLTAGYIVAVVAVEIYAIDRGPLPVLELVNLGLILALLTAGSAVVFRADGLFATAPPTAQVPSATLGEVDRAVLGRLTQWIEEETGYRESGLTIGALAARLDVQEHRLRRVINRDLGFRNFSDFLNHYRLRDARARLADPAEARVPVLTIALDLGYGSLSPFNRAFKATTGLTPREYRRRALDGDRIAEKS